jgi:fatty-acyl-CoA synthase
MSSVAVGRVSPVAAQRSGLYYTAINSHLTADEVAYIVNDCGAELLVSSKLLEPVAAALGTRRLPHLRHRLMIGGIADSWEPYEDAVDEQPATPIDDECEGDFMLYSSGTTGRPKGIQRPLTFAPMGEGQLGAVPFLQAIGVQDGSVYLNPAPLYHAAPLAWSSGAQRLGATVVVMEQGPPI